MFSLLWSSTSFLKTLLLLCQSQPKGSCAAYMELGNISIGFSSQFYINLFPVLLLGSSFPNRKE